MKKTYTKAMSSAIIMSLVLTAAIPKTLVKAAAGQVTRIGESDSYATAAKVATTNWISPKNVVLVCGEGYADAVSATVLAKQLDSPILLTTADSLNTSAKDALDTLKPQNIYVIGGTASISGAVREGLRSSNYNLIELGGKNRYETNIAVANQLVKLGVKADKVMLVGGDGFSDILSVTSVAASKGQILLLGTNTKDTMKTVIDFVKDNNSEVTVIGTNHTVNDATYKDLGAVERVAGGSDRFETNLNVLNKFNGDLKTDKLFVANASGDRYADALIASSLAGKWTAPLVIVDTENATATNKALSYIKSKINASTDLNVIGTSEVVSENTVSKINSVVPIENNPTVKLVSTNGLNQIKVLFNTELDKDTAELIQNYQIDGNNLNLVSEASATLQDDKRTVLITFAKPFQQFKDFTFVVKNSIMDRNLSNSIVRFEQKITFSDITPPTLESVTMNGGNKLIVKFSEPIRMSINDLSSMKINRQSIDSFGFNKSMTVLKDKSDIWSDRAEIYFDAPLPVGSNVFTVPNGEKGRRFDDGAGFSVKGTSLNFNVSLMGGTPEVTKVTGDTSGTIYVTYSRPMDVQTALEDTNYKLNGSTISVSSSDISFDEGSNDTIVKIKGLSYLLKNGENVLIANSNIEDTYGNDIKETRMNFNVGNDTIKPQITNITLVDNKAIRIKFNKDVVNSYATNRSNYKILDPDGIEMTYKIDKIESVYIDGNSKRTYDIKFKDNDDLKGSKYTLTVKNIIDTNSVANVMDNYTTTVYGMDNQQPKVTEIVRKEDDIHQVIVFFNKVMDESSILDSSNYFFKNGKGETQKLPSSATITPGTDNKSVSIEFPSNYIIEDGTEDRYVVKMGIANVKDKDGNLLETVAYTDNISTSSSNGPSIIDNTSKLYYESDDIKVRFSLTSPLDVLNTKDFTVNGQTPDGGMTVGNDVILTFKSGVKDNEKINNIKNAGSSTTINVCATTSVDAAGRKLKYSSTRLILPPLTATDSWIANSNKGSGGNSSVTIAFNQNIDDDVQTSYYDDFIFTNERTGQRLDVLSISIDGKNVIYKFNNGSIMTGDRISVHANTEVSNINIRGSECSNGDYAVYSPSRDDLKDRILIAH